MSEPYREREDYIPYRLNEDYSRYSAVGGQSNHLNDYSATGHSRLSNLEANNTQYVPKIIESGYIVGPPVAYTQQPSLPANFHAFSPSKPNLPILYENSPGINQSNLSPSNSRINMGPKIIVNSPLHRYPITQNRSYIVNQPPPTILVHAPPPPQLSKAEQVVSKAQYDRSVVECRNWEAKYNELHQRYMNLISGQGQQTRNEDESVRQDNYRLKQRIRELQNRQRGYNEGQQRSISELVEKYKESTLKECFLLLDRYRLECKQNQR